MKGFGALCLPLEEVRDRAFSSVLQCQHFLRAAKFSESFRYLHVQYVRKITWNAGVGRVHAPDISKFWKARETVCQRVLVPKIMLSMMGTSDECLLIIVPFGRGDPAGSHGARAERGRGGRGGGDLPGLSLR